MPPGRSLVVSGPMGSGKSTVAPLVAAQLGARAIDLDAEIEREAGSTVRALFDSEGEAAFRARESALLTRLLDDAGSGQGEAGAVIAVGGGALTSTPLRRLALRRAVVVTLRASTATLLERARAQGLASRPLLAGAAPAAALDRLLDGRREAYAEAHAQVDTDAAAPADVARRVADVWTREPIAVPLGARTYSVDVGRGVLAHLPAILAALGPRATLLVTDERVDAALGPALARALSGPTLTGRVVLPSGEAHKTVESIERIWDAALAAGLDRSGVVLAIGGGVVGDLAGFAASTLLRGVRFVQVPTTLLAMVDASVGGKTAIDRPQGKNLIGAFHQPSAVLADVDLLRTLPARDLRSGLAEVVKTALIGDAALLEALERDVDRVRRGDPDALVPLVRASIAHKAQVVAEDERDVTGARAALNFGHTLGHALEAQGGYTALTHGEAVSLGTIAALRIGVARGRTPVALLERATRLLGALGLPVALDPAAIAAALPWLSRDKKREGAAIAFVLVPELGRATLERLTVAEITAGLAR
ncbi:MAG: hypothetical protein NVS3B10_02400 [Polyangiales bacterium]